MANGWRPVGPYAARMAAVVVTGASTGIGAAVAQRMVRAGWEVFAGVRKREDGERLVEVSGSARLVPVLIDVVDQASVDAAAAEVTGALAGKGLDGIVNNAGIAVGGPVEHLPLDEWRRQLEVNVLGQIAATQAFLPLLRRAKGRIVFTGSISGRLSPPMLSPYSVSKHAVSAIAESLRHELKPAGIKTVVIEPGAVATPIWDKGTASIDELRRTLPPAALEQYAEFVTAMEKNLVDQARKGISPDACAAYYERALTTARPRARYLVGPDAKAGGSLARILPDRVRDLVVAKSAGL